MSPQQKKKRKKFNGIVADPVGLKKFHFKCPSVHTESAYAVSFMKYSARILGCHLNINTKEIKLLIKN